MLIWLGVSADGDIICTRACCWVLGPAHLKKPAPYDRSRRRMLQLQRLACMLEPLQCNCWLSGLQGVVDVLDEIIQAQRTKVYMLQRLCLQFLGELRNKKGRVTFRI